nr:MAG TPA: hypothetical protein [Caudoviricetes sp.]
MTFAQLSLIPQPVRRPVSQLTFSLFVLILFSSEMLEKLHGGGVRDDKSRVVRGCKNPAAFGLCMDGLNGQRHCINHCIGAVFRKGQGIFSQPCPYLDGLPVLAQFHQRGHNSGHCRGMVRGNLVLRKAGRRSITALVLINGRQSEFLPVAGPGELNLYFCVVHSIGTLISSKSAVSSVSTALTAKASRA